MPEGFSEEPWGYDNVSTLHPVEPPKQVVHERERNTATAEIHEESLFNEFSKKVNEYVREQMAEFDGTDEQYEQLDLIFDAMFAPFRIKELESGELKNDKERLKAVSARSQQLLAHYLIHAQSSATDEQSQQNMKDIAVMYDQFSKKSPRVERYWHGVLAHAVGVKAMLDLGLPCIGPSLKENPMEYTMDGQLRVDINGMEIYDWEHKGIDVITQFQRNAFLVDFKAARGGKLTVDQARSLMGITEMKRDYSESVLRGVYSLAEPGYRASIVHSLTVHVPLERQYYNNPELDSKKSDGQRYLNSLLTLKDSDRRMMLGAFMGQVNKALDVA